MPRRPNSTEHNALPAARYQPLVLVLAAVSSGIVLDRYTPLPWIAWWCTAIGALAAWLVCRRNDRDRSAAVFLFLAMATTGASWHHARWCLFGNDDLVAFASETPAPACITAVALEGPHRVRAPPPSPLRAIPTPERSRLAVRVTSIRDRDSWQPASGLAQLTVDGHLLGVRAGDELRIFSQLNTPRAPLNPGEFDFARHARADRTPSALRAEFPECVTVTDSASSWSIGLWTDRLRQACQGQIWRDLGRERSGLAMALLLGERGEFNGRRADAFVETGTVHLLSISGLHVGVLGMFLFWLFRLGWLPRTAALAAVAGLTIAYAVLIDAEPPALRATILVLVSCLSLYLGRPMLAFNTLAAAALLVLAWNPTELFRVGTQLSFLAMAALVWMGPRLAGEGTTDPLTRLIARTRPWPQRAARILGRNIWRGAVLSAAVWLVTTPLVLSQFHLVSPAALVLTPLLSAAVAVGLLSGFGVLLLGWLFPFVGSVLGRVCDGCLWWVESCVDAARDMPGSHFWTPAPGTWWIVTFYALLALWAAFPAVRNVRRWCVAVVAAWLAVGLWSTTAPVRGANQLECTFVSVGHGCSVLLELPDGQTLLYDAGQLGSPDAGARAISACLWSRGVTHLDGVIVSHADVDHYNALPELLRRFSVGAVYVSPLTFENQTGATQALEGAIRAANVPLREIYSGDRLRATNCEVRVLHPPRRGVIGSDNANSLVLAVEFAGRRLLLPGDLESPGLDDVLAEEPLDCDVVLVPHHGSAESDPPGFAAWSTPEAVVVSGGHRAGLPAVLDAYRQRGADVYHTAETGAVRVTLSAEGMNVVTTR